MVVTVLEGTCEPDASTGEFHTRRYNWRTRIAARTLHRDSRRERFASRVNTGAPRSYAVGERVWSPIGGHTRLFFAPPRVFPPSAKR